MKNFRIIVFALISLSLYTCERDDLCDEDTPTTPRLIIDFKDVANPESTKDVLNFRVEDPDDSEKILNEYNGTVRATQVILPLKTDTDETRFVMYTDYGTDDMGTPDDPSDDLPTGNADTLIITYTRKDVYVSRACSYKTIFEDVSVSVELETGDNNWIKFIEATNDNQVINEDETHFNIRH